jgi:N-acetylmuramoyl-L-alanine amidase
MLSLRQRAASATGQRGDIFLSIHLNSIQPSSSCGVETYYLGPSNDAERNAIAARENEQPGYSLSDMRSLLERIYADARRDESRRLAQAVQEALMRTLRKSDPALTDRGVKMAPFVVLVATEMPAILAEVSCLSNTAEAQRLSTAQHRETLAEALVLGIHAFARETGKN